MAGLLKILINYRLGWFSPSGPLPVRFNRGGGWSADDRMIDLILEYGDGIDDLS